jgi:Xaa-Pro aminopeptidase
MDRLEKLRKELEGLDLQALLVTDIYNIRYLSGFTGSTAVMVVDLESAFILTDSRYVVQAESQTQGRAEVIPFQREWVPEIANLAAKRGWQRLGFDDVNLRYHEWSDLKAALPSVDIIPVADPTNALRIIKDKGEIDIIRRAAKITDSAFTHVSSTLRPGMTEMETALAIDSWMRAQGAEKEGFDTIVASGPRSALPHGQPTERVISVGELIVLDFGAKCNGYHADITRTVLLGEPNEDELSIYHIVLEAQAAAIAAIRPGIEGREVDSIARGYIADRGYGDYFGHGLGHGLGLEVHDGRILAPGSEVVLQPGMVLTVEPGIYIPGVGGVRIEDDILVTETDCEILTRSPKEELGFRN